jgi:hypothetical protein
VRPAAALAAIGWIDRAGYAGCTRAARSFHRLDVKAVKECLGESYRRFEVATISTVIRIKAVQRFAAAA